MRKRKIVLFITVLALMFSIVFSSAAAAAVEKTSEDSVKIKKDKAVEIAKTVLDNPDRYGVSNILLNTAWPPGRNSWNIDFYVKQNPGGNANVSVDADTGEILGFNIWDYYYGQQNFIATITRSEAREIAEDFLKTKLRQDMDSYELQDQSPYIYSYGLSGVKNEIQYNFNYVKKLNGIPFTNYSMSITVDATDGKVKSYHYNPVDIDLSKLPSTDGILTADEAMEKYRDSVSMALQYVNLYVERYYGPAKAKTMLAYLPSTGFNMMDTVTGKALNYDGSELDINEEQYKELAENPVPLNPDAKLGSKAVTEKEAETIAQKYKVLAEKALGVKFDREEPEHYSNPYYLGKGEMLYFSWHMYKDNESAYLNITINSETGHVIDMSMGRDNYGYDMMLKEGKKVPEVKEKISWQQGKEKAIELIKDLIPEQYGFFADQSIEPKYTEEVSKYMREHSYNFGRVVNGLRYRDNNISVDIDRETGKLVRFYFTWSDTDFPPVSTAVSKEEVEKKYFEGIEPKLSYMLQSTFDSVSGETKFADAPKLVYFFKNKGDMIDATTGKSLDWAGREIKTEQEPLLSEHWAKRSVEMLIAQGIIKNPYVDYDAELTRAEAVKMLSLAKGMGNYDVIQSTGPSFNDVTEDSEYYYFIENAVKQKILTKVGGNFNGEEKITKGEFVKLLANLMGFYELAGKNEIFKFDGGTNIAPDSLGSVAICYALDVLPVKEGEIFDGSAKVTYAEAAVALYKVLKYIK